MRNATPPFTAQLTAQLIFCSTLLAFAVAGQAQTAVQTVVVKPAVATPAIGEAITSPATTHEPASKTNQLIERITVEDAGSRIDEVRFGGQTRSITVQPKGGMPAYDIQPETGARTWKIFGY